MTDLPIIEKIAEEANLRNAWIKARYFAQTGADYYDSYTYEEFAKNLDANIAILSHQITANSFSFDNLRIVEIPKGDQTRKIYFNCAKDAVVVHAILNVIGPIFENTFSPNSFGNRLSYGEKESKAPFRDWYDQYNKYITNAVKILLEPNDSWYQISDITSFYPSIDTNILRGLIAQKITDTDCLVLIENLLELRAINLDGFVEVVPGLPPGTAYAHFFANIYLDPFDKFMERRASKYSRYVDDFCFCVPNEMDFKKVIGELLDFFKNNLGGLTLNGGKTEQHPITDEYPLIAHTRKLMYDLRFGVMDAIDYVATTNFENLEQSKKRAEALFRDLFLRVENEEDIKKIVDNSSGFIAHKLPSVFVSSDDALAIAYGLLSQKPPRTTAIRALIAVIMRISISESANISRLGDFILASPSIYKIIFLQLLPGFSHRPNEIREILFALCEDSNYLVRSNAYLSIGIIDIKQVRKYRELEQSEYALTRLVYGMTLDDNDVSIVWTEFRTALASGTEEILRAVIVKLELLLANSILSRDDLQVVFPGVRDHVAYSLFSIVSTLKLIGRYGDSVMLQAVISKTAEFSPRLSQRILQIQSSIVIAEFVQKQELSSLFRFSDTLDALGYKDLAMAGYLELISRATDPEIQKQATEKKEKLNYEPNFQGLPSWFDWTAHYKGRYCSVSDEPDYLCGYYEDPQNKRRGTFEIISLQRLKSQQIFNSADEWFDYLGFLKDQGLVEIVNFGEFQEGDVPKVFAFYEFSSGFLPVNEWLQRKKFHNDETSLVDFCFLVSTALDKSKFTNGYQFQNASPCNILWDATGRVRFANVGSSLGANKYVCGISGCFAPDYEEEIGITVSEYFLGLLLLQILADRCPIDIVNKQAARYSKQVSLPELLNQYDISPQFRSVLLRMLNKSPELRYQNFSPLIEDLAHIKNFCAILQSVKKDAVLARQFTLVDYVSFRLDVICRNPKIANSPVSGKVNFILERLSSDLEYYLEDDLSLWDINVDIFAHRNYIPSLSNWVWINPEAKRFYGMAVGWLNLLQEIQNKDNRFSHLDCRIYYLLLARVIYVESLAVLQGIVQVDENKKRQIGDWQRLFLELDNQKDDNLQSISLFVSENQEGNSATINLNRCQYDLINTVGRTILEKKSSASLKKDFSYDTVLLAIVFLTSEITFLDGEKDVFAKLNNPSSAIAAYKFGFVTLAAATSFDKTIGHILDNNVVLSVDQFTEQVNHLVGFLRKVNPCRRKVGRLISYNPISITKGGQIDIGVYFYPQLFDFTDHNVFTWGEFIKSPDLSRAVLADIYYHKRKKKLSSILTVSTLFKKLEAKSRAPLLVKGAKFLRKFDRLRGSIIVLVLAIVTFLILYFQDSNLLLSTLATMVQSILIPLLVDLLKNLLPLISPENTRRTEY